MLSFKCVRVYFLSKIFWTGWGTGVEVEWKEEIKVLGLFVFSAGARSSQALSVDGCHHWRSLFCEYLIDFFQCCISLAVVVFMCKYLQYLVYVLQNFSNITAPPPPPQPDIANLSQS